MATYFNIPFASPFKFVPYDGTGIHFDDQWAVNQLRIGERRIKYQQKWVKSKTTKLQIESGVIPDNLKVWDLNMQVVKQFTWAAVVTYVSYKVYETTVDISDLQDGFYFLYQKAGTWKVISECIHSKSSWRGVLLFEYRNSYNDNDVAWTATGATFSFFCEASIPPVEYTPEKVRTDFVKQGRKVKTLKGTSYRKEKLEIGIALPYWANGVPPWVTDIVNRIFDCDSILIQGKAFQADSGAKLEVSRVKGNPFQTATLDIVDALNRTGLNFGDIGSSQAVTTAYEIETDFFGPGTAVPVIEVETNG